MMNVGTARRLSAGEKASWAAVRELCCRTGNNGDPIAPERWELFARIWIEPYEKILPHWTYIAGSGEEVVGYLTGCPDTRVFHRTRFWRATLPLLADVAAGRYPQASGAREFVKQTLGLRKSPEDFFSRNVRRTISTDYPAHLHVNVDAGYRRKGVGRQLMDCYFADLRRDNVPGVHLYCGADPVDFYRSMGFQELAGTEIRGVSIFALGARL